MKLSFEVLLTSNYLQSCGKRQEVISGKYLATSFSEKDDVLHTPIRNFKKKSQRRRSYEDLNLFFQIKYSDAWKDLLRQRSPLARKKQAKRD